MRYLRKISKGLEYITERIVISSFIIMLSLVLLQVIFRYLLHLPISWAEELARYLFTWLIFLGASLVSMQQKHLAITVFLEKIPIKFREFVVITMDAIVIVFLFILTAKSIDLLQQVKTTTSSVLQISMAYPYLSITLGGGFMLIHTIINVIERIVNLVGVGDESSNA